LSRQHSVKIRKEPGLSQSSLVFGWSDDVGDLGRRTTDYLNRKLEGREFAEIEPDYYFQLGGVTVKGDLAQFPESKFYVCPEQELVIFRSDPPGAEWYGFLNSILDVAERHCHVKELYVIGAMVSLDAHTTPRQLLAVVNSAELKDILSQYDVMGEMDYQTPSGERPTLNSLLLWLAKNRNIPGVGLWVPIPFYLTAVEDAEAQKRVLSFLNQKLNLKIDFADLDEEIQEQNRKLAQARSQFPEIDGYIGKLESNLMLSEEENGELMRRIEDSLRERS